MATTPLGPTPGYRTLPLAEDLLLRETMHRSANDLQLVIGMLSLQSRRAQSAETREALKEATGRIAVLARARADLNPATQTSIAAALGQVCEALRSQTEPRGILLSLDAAATGRGLSPNQIITLALTVNELATNAIKHAFEDGRSGRVAISARDVDGRGLVVMVDDDGLPFASPEGRDGGLGLGLVKRLVASIGGLLISPVAPSKAFEIRVPLTAF